MLASSMSVKSMSHPAWSTCTHHLELPFPSLSATSDANERPLLGPNAPFVRALDGFTPTDPAKR
ncbi:uncharacterized protein BDV17DRAFT_273126 [Aspergillus undulatus]|uniref:uncharacterized protein n=1 Tax=Aspergillus undulatus TaxID=1810928 RepID=UPI003CCC9B50